MDLPARFSGVWEPPWCMFTLSLDVCSPRTWARWLWGTAGLGAGGGTCLLKKQRTLGPEGGAILRGVWESDGQDPKRCLEGHQTLQNCSWNLKFESQWCQSKCKWDRKKGETGAANSYLDSVVPNLHHIAGYGTVVLAGLGAEWNKGPVACLSETRKTSECCPLLPSSCHRRACTACCMTGQ